MLMASFQARIRGKAEKCRKGVDTALIMGYHVGMDIHTERGGEADE